MGRGDIHRTAEANPFDKFSLGVQALIEVLMIERMADNDALVTRYLSDPEFREVVSVGLLKAIFGAVTSQQHQTATLDV